MSLEQSYSVLHPFTFMQFREQADVRYFEKHNVCLTRGDGVWAEDNHGRKYVYATTAVPSVGLCNKAITEKVTAQMETLSFASTCAQTHPNVHPLAEKLLSLTGPQFGAVFFSNDGSGAVETAMRLVRQYFISKGESKRKKFISLEGNYHGTTFGSGSVTHMGIQESFGPGLENCYAAPFPNMFRQPVEGGDEWTIRYCLELLEELIFELNPSEVAAIVLEPVQGVNGIYELPKEYAKRVRAMSEKYGILLIMDEVATGAGRTGHWVMSHDLGIQPDLLALSKGLTGGYFPMGATLISDQLMKQLFSEGGIFLHGSTQSGHPVGCAAALAVIELMEKEKLIDNAKAKGERILHELRQAIGSHPNVGDIRGKGLMLAVEFVEDKETKQPVEYAFGERLSKAMHEEGVLGNWFNGVFIIYPPLTINDAETSFLIQAMVSAVHRLDE